MNMTTLQVKEESIQRLLTTLMFVHSRQVLAVVFELLPALGAEPLLFLHCFQPVWVRYLAVVLKHYESQHVMVASSDLYQVRQALPAMSERDRILAKGILDAF